MSFAAHAIPAISPCALNKPVPGVRPPWGGTKSRFADHEGLPGPTSPAAAVEAVDDRPAWLTDTSGPAAVRVRVGGGMRSSVCKGEDRVRQPAAIKASQTPQYELQQQQLWCSPPPVPSSGGDGCTGSVRTQRVPPKVSLNLRAASSDDAEDPNMRSSVTWWLRGGKRAGEVKEHRPVQLGGPAGGQAVGYGTERRGYTPLQTTPKHTPAARALVVVVR